MRERILRMFVEMHKDALDLHVLFEAAGNDPAEREKVLDALEELVRDELLEARGNDFYALTSKGGSLIDALSEGSSKRTVLHRYPDMVFTQLFGLTELRWLLLECLHNVFTSFCIGLTHR